MSLSKIVELVNTDPITTSVKIAMIVASFAPMISLVTNARLASSLQLNSAENALTTAINVMMIKFANTALKDLLRHLMEDASQL